LVADAARVLLTSDPRHFDLMRLQVSLRDRLGERQAELADAVTGLETCVALGRLGLLP
jgi:hypothetical protein